MLKRLKILFVLSWATLTCIAQMNTDRLTAIGRNALYFDDYVLSIQYFNQVIKLKPYLAEPYLYRAIAKIQLGDLNGAERDCSQAIANSPFLPGAYYTRGFIYRGLKELDKAELDFTEALVFSPENKTYILLRADVRSAAGKYDKALEDIDFLLQKEPESASYNFEKGVISMQMNDTLGALNSFSKAIESDGQNAANWSARGLVNSLLGHDDEALLDFNQAINLGTTWAGDYINRGILFYRRHNYRGAMTDYDKALELDPNNAQSHYNRGLLRQELGDYNNALVDFDAALDIEPENTEIHYQRGLVNMQLKHWEEAIKDFDILISKYPYFLPSYYLGSQAKTALGDNKGAFRYRQKADELEKNKERITAQQQINTDVQLAEAQPQKKDRKKEFSNRAAQNQQEKPEEERYKSVARGAVQKKYAEVVNQPNITLSYYAQQDAMRRTSYYHYTIDDYNRYSTLPAPLLFTLQEITLTADMVNRHFEQISRLTDRLERGMISDDISKAELLFARAVEFALVQDYKSAIEDCNRSIYLLPTTPPSTERELGLWVATYFSRANWRYKLIDYQRNAIDESDTEQLKLDFELMLRDYDQLIINKPDFSFAYYNTANMLCLQRDFKAAVEYYSKAIEVDPDFAEAFFNRGLTYIYTDDNDKGLSDLSKAGELGIYQAYNLISRFK